ncbi:MAG: methyltransferase family protein [Gemmatimonadaceae bacterium]
MVNPNDPHRPDIHIAPPLVFMAGFVFGFLLDRYVIALRISGAAAREVALVGLVLMVLGVGLAIWGVLTFRHARTTIMPFRAASTMVRNGPYRFTRNPMYVGMALGYAGFALVFNTVWPLLVLPLVVIAMVRLVITREEAYLESAFGEDYRAYKRDVRRWL